MVLLLLSVRLRIVVKVAFDFGDVGESLVHGTLFIEIDHEATIDIIFIIKEFILCGLLGVKIVVIS